MDTKTWVSFPVGNTLQVLSHTAAERIQHWPCDLPPTPCGGGGGLVAKSCPTLAPARLLCPWDSPGKNTGVGCHFLLQGIFPSQGLNPGLLHCRQILYQLSCEGSPNPSGIRQMKVCFWFLCFPLNAPFFL